MFTPPPGEVKVNWNCPGPDWGKLIVSITKSKEVVWLGGTSILDGVTTHLVSFPSPRPSILTSSRSVSGESDVIWTVTEVLTKLAICPRSVAIGAMVKLRPGKTTS